MSACHCGKEAQLVCFTLLLHVEMHDGTAARQVTSSRLISVFY